MFLVYSRWIDGELHVKTDQGWLAVGIFADEMHSTPVVTLTKAGFPSMSMSGEESYKQKGE